MQKAMAQAFHHHEAAEMVRRRQQGHGRPIITVEHDGYRLVAVKNRMCWSKNWVFFTDFLLDHLKDVMGRDWGERVSSQGGGHPIIRWLQRANEAVKSAPPGERTPLPEAGYLTCLFRLAYSLYLIAHHDEIPPSLVQRLRRSQDDVFRPAVYETLVAAAFAVAGFTIEGAEGRRSGERKPEFRATGPSGRVYAVEAKCKRDWKSTYDLNDAAFREELRAWLRDKLYSASCKRLASPVYWFELSITVSFNTEQAKALSGLIAEIVEKAADITIAGEPAVPAHVVITNRVYMAVEDGPSGGSMAMMTGFRMPDYATGQMRPLETLFEIRDRHREISKAFECLREVDQIPLTFDGGADELTDGRGRPIPTMKVGEPIGIDFPDGTKLTGTLRQVLPVGETAWVVVEDGQGRHQMATMPLTQAEALAAARHGPSVFGSPEAPHKDHGDDILSFYDAMLRTMGTMNRSGLLRQLESHPQRDAFADLTTPELVVRVAREVTASVYTRSRVRPF